MAMAKVADDTKVTDLVVLNVVRTRLGRATASDARRAPPRPNTARASRRLRGLWRCVRLASPSAATHE